MPLLLRGEWSKQRCFTGRRWLQLRREMRTWSVARLPGSSWKHLRVCCIWGWRNRNGLKHQSKYFFAAIKAECALVKILTRRNTLSRVLNFFAKLIRLNLFTVCYGCFSCKADMGDRAPRRARDGCAAEPALPRLDPQRRRLELLAVQGRRWGKWCDQKDMMLGCLKS